MCHVDVLGPVTERRNVLIVHLRGTGRSDAVNCNAVHNWRPSEGNQAYIDAIGACATKLNTDRRRPDGSLSAAPSSTQRPTRRGMWPRLFDLLRTRMVGVPEAVYAI